MTYEQTDVLDRKDEVAATRELTTRTPLFADHDLADFRERWRGVQGQFVDDPRSSVRTADQLVASLMSHITKVFADERAKLEQSWGKGDDVSTEDLRLALQRYRSFFDRLLAL